jgi:hypothetical protein
LSGPPAGCNTLAFPNGLTTGDFDIDGNLDLGVAAGNFPAGTIAGTGSFSALGGDGSGSFKGRTDTTGFGAMSAAVVVGDFDNNGKLDAAVANYYSNTVVILIHN